MYPYHLPEQILQQIHPITLQTPLLCPSPTANLSQGTDGWATRCRRSGAEKSDRFFVWITKKEQGILWRTCASLETALSSGEGGRAGLWLPLQITSAALTVLIFALCFCAVVTRLSLAWDRLLTQAGISRSLSASLLIEMLTQTAPVIPGTGLYTPWFALRRKGSRWKDALSLEPTTRCWGTTNISMNGELTQAKISNMF